MSAKYLAGFAVICGVAVAGLDYSQQAKASENGLGIQGYLSSVSSRAGFSASWFEAEVEPSQPQEPAAKTPSKDSRKLVCTTAGNSKRCRSSG